MNENNYNANEHLYDSSDGEPPEVETNSDAVAAGTSKESDKKSSRKNPHRSNHRNKDNNNRPTDDQFEKDQYNRQSIMNIEDQFETSKLVLQLVTDSSFNMTQINGQRKLGGPPPGWKGPPPGPGCEIFVGKIPRTLYEHEIYPIFRKMGEVYEIRLMMDFSGTNRGYCFVMFGRPEFAQKAINELNDFEIRPGRKIGVVASINNCRLYVGQLPHDIPSVIVIKKIYDITDDVGQVSVYRNGNGQARYALIAYKTHRGAAMARRRLVPERASLFEGAEVSIDWAHPGMYPSNVVEDSGIADEHGNIEMSRIVVGNENRRYQTRRKARDEFLDSSIKSYIESERALENHRTAPRGRQQTSQKRAIDCYFNGGNGSGNRITTTATTTTATSDSKSSSSSAASARSSFNSASRSHSKPGKGLGKISTADVARKSSDSSFDSPTNNRGSCSSESSSGSSSRSDRGIVDTAIKNLCYGYPEFYVDSDNGGNQSCESGETKISNAFNLFESYTFSKTAAAAVAAAVERRAKADDMLLLTDHSTGSAKNTYSANFSLGIESEPEEEKLFSINDSRSVVVAPPKNSYLKNGSTETFSRATGALPKEKSSSQKSPFSSASSDSKKPIKIAAQSVDKYWGKKTESHPNIENIENLNLHPSAIWQNHQNDREVIVNRDCWPFENVSRGSNYENARSLLPSQNRGGTCFPLIFDKNNKDAKTEMTTTTTTILPNSRILTQRNGCYNTPNFLNFNAYTNARRALIQTNRGLLTGCDFPSNNTADLPNFYRITQDFSGSGLIPPFQSQSQSQSQFLASNDRFSNINATGISARQNSANSIQGAGARSRPDVIQNRRFSSGRNNGPRTGRPILSRSHASFCNEN